jgi:hypothetical protein
MHCSGTLFVKDIRTRQIMAITKIRITLETLDSGGNVANKPRTQEVDLMSYFARRRGA